MAQDRSIVLAGTSEEEEAFLRLLLRKAAPHLKEPWVLGSDEESADVVITDPLTIAGNVAIGNAKRHGVPYLVLSDSPRRGEEQWTLRRPPTVVDLSRMLNGLEFKSDPGMTVLSSQGDNFYNIDLESAGEEQGGAGIEDAGKESPRVETHSSDDPDALFRRDPLARAVAVLKTHHLTADTGIERTTGTTQRGDLRALSYGNPFARNFDQAPTGMIDGARLHVDNESGFSLLKLLSRDVVFGPCQHQLPGHPALIVDPKLDVFHSEATLAELRPYCARSYTRAEWNPVTNQALKSLRADVPARSCADLRFMCALDASKGRLDGKLDPGGTFWLQGVLKLDASLDRQQWILHAMQEASRLNDIVTASDTSMAEVMDVVNALSAIGMLGTRLRERLR